MLECIGFSEIDKHAEAVYRYHFDHRNYGDATQLVPDTLPDFDFLIAGFPCQAFSIAGKRQGFDDARGTLFFEIARVLSHKRPSHFLLENVGGLRSHDGGRTMQRILGVLSSLGYFVEVPLLNSKNFGVPQNRERVFFIGHLGERCEREILSVENGNEDAFGSFGQRNDISHTITNDDKARGSYVIASTAILSKGGKRKNRDSASCVTGGGHSGGNHSDMDLIQIGGHGNSQGGRVYAPTGISQTISSVGGGQGAKTGLYAIPVLTPDRPTKRQNGRRMKDQGEARFTLTAQDQHGVFNGQRIRRLTPVECERLQGLPDDYTALGRYAEEVRPVSDTQRYKGLGNAFTVNVIEAIITEMLNRGCLI